MRQQADHKSEDRPHADVRPEASANSRAAVPSGQMTIGRIVAMQRLAGNRASNALIARATNAGGPPVQRKLSFDNTAWSSAKFLDVSLAGGGGVMFAGEAGREIVVKPGEDMAAEGALAAMLHNDVRPAVASGTRSEQAVGGAPGFRIVQPDEAREIQTGLAPLVSQVGQHDSEKDRSRKQARVAALMGNLGRPGVVVQDLAAGKTLRDALKQVAKHTEKTGLFGLGNSRKLRKDSPLRIFTDPRAIRALGANTAVDLFTGNRDRLIKFYNDENFMVSPYSLTMIDNIWMGNDASYFTETEVSDSDGKKSTITQDISLQAWLADAEVKMLAAGDVTGIASHVWTQIIDGAAFNTRKTDRTSFASIMAKQQPKFMTAFEAGLLSGKSQMISSLGRLLVDPSKLAKMMPGTNITEMQRMISRRRAFLMGAAWQQGTKPPR